MGSVADNDARVAVVVRVAFDVHEGEVAVCEELSVDGFRADEVGDDAREMLIEEGDEVVRGVGFQVEEDGFRGEKIAGKPSVLCFH